VAQDLFLGNLRMPRGALFPTPRPAAGGRPCVVVMVDGRGVANGRGWSVVVVEEPIGNLRGPVRHGSSPETH